jgi:hypothetical protein
MECSCLNTRSRQQECAFAAAAADAHLTALPTLRYHILLSFDKQDVHGSPFVVTFGVGCMRGDVPLRKRCSGAGAHSLRWRRALTGSHRRVQERVWLTARANVKMEGQAPRVSCSAQVHS